MLEDTLNNIAHLCLQYSKQIVTAESCTGGLVAKLITDLAGSSQWFERGFVTYSNLAKEQMLGVDAQLLNDFGAVSEPVAEAMAAGALRHSSAQFALSITGIAGPDGGSVAKPVGTVCFAWAYYETMTDDSMSAASAESIINCLSARQLFSGDREAVRNQSALYALLKTEQLIRKQAV